MLNQWVDQYGKRIIARDGWIDPASKPDAKSRAGGQAILNGPHDSGLVSGIDDPKAMKQLLEDEDVEN